ATGAGCCQRESRLALVFDGFESGDDVIETVLDSSKILREPELPVGVGSGDETPVGASLFAMDLQELGGGLEGGRGETGVGMRTVRVGWTPAVAVGEAVADAGQVVFDPLGVGGERVGLVVEVLAGGVDPLATELLEGVPDGAIVDGRIAGGHAGAGVTEEF